MRRDFTYIDDVVEAVLRTAIQTPEKSTDAIDELSHTGSVPYRLYNIGNHEPVEIEYLISLLEFGLGKTAKKNYLPMQPGDVVETYADIESLRAAIDFYPSTPIVVGVARFVEWYQSYHG
jgi:UDP-glucuronate 4-epimerase